VYASLKIFAEVDINDDKHMEWNEFMQYIIDAVTSTSISSQGSSKNSVLEMINQLKANNYKRFSKTEKVIDKVHHTNVIESAFSISKLR
jgi:hypothetical protein